MFEKLNTAERWLFDILSLVLVIFYSYSAVLVPAATQYHRGIYVVITYVLVFLIYRSRSAAGRIIDYLLMTLSVLCIGYWMWNFEAINYRVGAETVLDQWIAMAGVLIGVELARRVIGNVFVVLGGVMLLYGVYGDYMPDLISHAGDTFPALCTSIFYKSDGVFGIMANVLATYVILFVIFGAFLEASGAQRFFVDFPLAAVGHRIGGPAKVAVIASGLFGSISGSAIANTVSTGNFTIPMMKKAGFKPHVAGAIEPAASIGGMFMPPIMGAGGFIMSELTGVPYSTIMLVAVFPALMYFFSVYVMVHYEARQHGIRGEKAETGAGEIFRRRLVLRPAAGGHHRADADGVLARLFRHTGHGDLHRRELVARGHQDRSAALSGGGPRGGREQPQDRRHPGGHRHHHRRADLQRPGAHLRRHRDRAGGRQAVADHPAHRPGVPGPGHGRAGDRRLPDHRRRGRAAAHGAGRQPHRGAHDRLLAVPGLEHHPAGVHRRVHRRHHRAGGHVEDRLLAFKFAKFLYLAPFIFGYVPAFSLDGGVSDIVIAFVLIIIGTWGYSWLLSGVWLDWFSGGTAKA